tara:strand:+ start:2033 stop:2878 length:846 start_codon:yes stop_codon:yes gene_type:complete
MTEIRNFKVSESVKQNLNAQDYTKFIKYGDINIMILCDGHGTDNVINMIKSLYDNNWIDILKSFDNKIILEELKKIIPTGVLSGSTITIVFILPDRIRVMWMGDSCAVIMIDGDIIKKTIDHSVNDNNKHKLIDEGYTFRPERSCKAINSDTINISTDYRVYKNGLGGCNLYRALGDQEIYDKELETFDILYSDFGKGNYQITIASDGIWDVVLQNDTKFLWKQTAKNIVDKSYNKWNQEWKIMRNGEIIYIDKEKQIPKFLNWSKNMIDDISCISCIFTF